MKMSSEQIPPKDVAIPPKALGGVIVAALCFSTIEVVTKFGASDIDPFQLTFLRFFIGGLVILPFAIRERREMQEKITIKDAAYAMLLGIICVPVSMFFFQLSVLHSSAATAAVVFSTNPVFAIIFAHFMTSDDKFNRRKAYSLLAAIPGIILMVRPWDVKPGDSLFGAAMCLISTATFGLYTVMGGKSVKRVGTFTQTTMSFLFGSFIIAAVMIPLGKPLFAGVMEHLPVILWTSVVVSGVGYISLFSAIKNSNATTGSYTYFIKPALSTAIAVVVLHEKVLWNMYFGIALILLASWINFRMPDSRIKGASTSG